MAEREKEPPPSRPPGTAWALTIAALVFAAAAGTAAFVLPALLSRVEAVRAIAPLHLYAAGVACAVISLALLAAALFVAAQGTPPLEALLFLGISLAVAVIIGRIAAPFVAVLVPFLIYRSRNKAVETVLGLLQWMAGGLGFLSLAFAVWGLAASWGGA